MCVTCDDHIEVGILLAILSLPVLVFTGGAFKSSGHAWYVVGFCPSSQADLSAALPAWSTVVLAFPFDAVCLSLQSSLLLLVKTCSVVSAV